MIFSSWAFVWGIHRMESECCSSYSTPIVLSFQSWQEGRHFLFLFSPYMSSLVESSRSKSWAFSKWSCHSWKLLFFVIPFFAFMCWRARRRDTLPTSTFRKLGFTLFLLWLLLLLWKGLLILHFKNTKKANFCYWWWIVSDIKSCNFNTNNTVFSSLLAVKPGTVICILACSPAANIHFLTMWYILGFHIGFF